MEEKRVGGRVWQGGEQLRKGRKCGEREKVAVAREGKGGGEGGWMDGRIRGREKGGRGGDWRRGGSAEGVRRGRR